MPLCRCISYLLSREEAKRITDSHPVCYLHPRFHASQLALHEADNTLEVTWGDGAQGRFHGCFLRDNAPAYFDPATGQRTKNTLALGADAYALAHTERLSNSSGLLRVAWRDGFRAEFASAWLRRHCHDTRHQYRVRPRLWGADLLGHFPGHVLPTLAYEDVVRVAGAGAGWQRSAEGFRQWVTALRDYGVALVEGLPLAPGTVMRMAGLISYHRKVGRLVG